MNWEERFKEQKNQCTLKEGDIYYLPHYPEEIFVVLELKDWLYTVQNVKKFKAGEDKSYGDAIKFGFEVIGHIPKISKEREKYLKQIADVYPEYAF